MSKEIEEWRPIQGFEGLYEVSDWGRVKSLKFGKEKMLKGGKDKDGYLLVQLCQDGKRVMKKVHRLVAEAFLPNPNNLPQVNHKDECKTNNNVLNLEFCDSKYNNNYSLSKCVDQIDASTGEVVRQWESTAECGRNGFLSGMVSKCALGKYKQYKGFIWKYVADNNTLKFY